MWNKITELITNLMQFLLSVIVILGFVIITVVALPLLVIVLLFVIIIGCLYWVIYGKNIFDKLTKDKKEK